MTVKELTELTDFTVLALPHPEMQIDGCYIGDLLSWVMANGSEGMAWITVQTHMNVIAVASLLDFACVIIPENLPVEAPIIKKAQDEDIIILSSSMTAYELVTLLAGNGVPSAKKG